MHYLDLARLSDANIARLIEDLQNVQKNEPNSYTDKWENASTELGKLFNEMNRRTT